MTVRLMMIGQTSDDKWTRLGNMGVDSITYKNLNKMGCKAVN